MIIFSVKNLLLHPKITFNNLVDQKSHVDDTLRGYFSLFKINVKLKKVQKW